jgi:hypothetical protein
LREFRRVDRVRLVIQADRAAMRERLRRLAEETAAVDPGLRPMCTALVAELDEPLRVAVVGRVNAGKSTLVNALLGRRVAPTGNVETTTLVTWYRYGAPERAELRLLDGGTLALPGTEPGLPAADLPVDRSLVSHAIVHLQEAALKELTLIDTPGLAAATGENEAATRRAVLDAEQAHALLYVLRDRELADDVAFLREFGAATGSRGGTALDTIGVLTHADEFGSGPWSDTDPVAEAASFARRIAARRTELADVLTVAGRLAEAVAVGGVTERDAAVLGALAGLDLEDVRDRAGLPPTVPADRVDDLVAHLGAYGVAHGRAAARGGAAALSEWARRTGGSDALRAALRAHYIGRHAQLRAERALAALERAADRSAERSTIRDLLAEARGDPALHPLAELHAWEALRAVEPGSALLARLTGVIDALDDREAVGLPAHADGTAIRRTARAAAEAAQAEAVLASLVAERTAALTLSRSYRRIAARWPAP